MAAPASALLRLYLPAALAIALLLATCDGNLGTWLEPQADAAAQLHGTWLREVQEKGTRARRVLTLAPDGAFRETVRVVDARGGVTLHEHLGTWFFDGTNLKRKYRLMDGEPPSRLNLPFATFQIAFESRNEFVGIDHIHGNRIRYQRVPEDTQP
jgi:hypothetical protein